MKLLHVIASPRLEGSTTLQISDKLIDELGTRRQDLEVETLDLFQADLPAIAGDNIEAKYTLLAGMPIGRDHADSWTQIEQEIDRFRAADAYVITAPMWNFGIPSRRDADERLARGERRGVDDAPPVVDPRLGDRVEVHRVETRRVHRHDAGGNVVGPQQRDGEVGEVAAHARARQQRVDRAVGRTG